METTSLPTVAPAADIYELADAYEIRIDVPGVSEKDVDVELERNELKIHARAGNGAEREASYSEYRPRAYERVFTLGHGVDRDKVSAHVADGVLRLTLPKAKEMKPRKISIKRG